MPSPEIDFSVTYAQPQQMAAQPQVAQQPTANQGPKPRPTGPGRPDQRIRD